MVQGIVCLGFETKAMKRVTVFLSLAVATTVAFGQWGLFGNGTTNPTTNYLGTTDNNALMLRTNATQRLRINANQTYTIGPFSGQSFPALGLTCLSKVCRVPGPPTASGGLCPIILPQIPPPLMPTNSVGPCATWAYSALILMCSTSNTESRRGDPTGGTIPHLGSHRERSRSDFSNLLIF